MENLKRTKRLFVLLPGSGRDPNILNTLHNSLMTSFSRTLTGERKLTTIQKSRNSQEVHVHQIAETPNFS